MTKHVHRLTLLAVLSLSLAAACAGPASAPPRSDAEIVFDIGATSRAVTTGSVEARRWFDRGLALTFGFNHEEALRCFDLVTAADPRCAMGHWGRAYVLGPNYNDTMPDDARNKMAEESVRRAAAECDDETPVERALIEALRVRNGIPAGSDRAPFDRAYADAMRRVRAAFPDDADVCALTAEALMQLRPWKLWTADGAPAPEIPEIRAVLEAGLARWPDHPALCHLYIHAMEAGPDVAQALPAARRLENLAPGLGHLVHMPSHIYIWTGHYDDVIRTNVRAVETDGAFVRLRGRENMFTAYRVHNLHFVAYGAMWQGRRALALEYARAIPGEIPPALIDGAGDLFDVFVATPLHVMVRFGMWDEILREPEPAANLPATRAVWRYARGVALASLGRVAEAEREQAEFLTAKAAVPPTRLLFQNRVSDILGVAEKVLAGEIAYRKGEHDRAFALLREAVALDGRLAYDEPWGWMEPARHALGALLTEQGRYAEAIPVYEADLKRHPENGWSLHGLAECLDGVGRRAEAAAVRARFTAAWSRADVAIRGSCFCKTR